uniref:Uncharacterized protein n=1 Tax=Oryza glumipatula TaxID=40148 RepID=A0A0D9ZB03_9ORYZ
MSWACIGGGNATPEEGERGSGGAAAAAAAGVGSESASFPSLLAGGHPPPLTAQPNHHAFQRQPSILVARGKARAKED